MYMNLIFDMDGTICFKGQPISKNILNLLLELQESGHFIGFASARPCRDMLPILDNRFKNHLLIGANGAMIYYQGKPICFTPIPAKIAEEIVNILDDYHAEYFIDDKWNYSFNLKHHHPFLMNVDPHKLANHIEIDQIESFIKIVVLSCNNFEELSKRIAQLDVTIHYHSTEGILDITYKGVNKMAALEESGLSLEKFVCFGNDMNDLPLFQKAHYSVVIGEYEPLLMIAKDQILVDEKVEQNIISKLQELSAIFV